LGSKPTVRASDSIAAAAATVLRCFFEQVLDNQKGTRAGEDIEALHDMRVATRRLRAALRTFRKPIGRDLLEPHRAELKWLASALGQARDLDVWIEYLDAYLPTVAQEHRDDTLVYIQTERAERESRRQRLIAALDSSRFGRFQEGFRRLLDTDLPACGVDETVGPFAAKSIRKQMKRVLAYSDGIKAAPEAELHRLRIAGKRLRYTGEFFADCFGVRVKEMIQMLRDMQDALGALHDTVVWRERIGETKCAALVDLKQHLSEEAAQHRRDFFTIWPRLTSKRSQKALRKELKDAAA